ncbi:DUF7742 family protein [Loktanella sp. S4079]|uniref:DUF7742 family protein n=1 Tax=Loktanella sp. S4079 TaxID=579483 RepID=UPI000696D46F|nr:hypothetical protein [Loktanella sp. S4079]
MLQVQLADIEAAARVLYAVPAPARKAKAQELCRNARLAHAHRARTGFAHPRFGNGTLMSAATKQKSAPRAAFCDRAFVECLVTIAMVLMNDRDL